MQGNNINTVYVNTWRFYAGSYPYNANGEQDRTKIGVKGSVWLYGKDSNGNSFELDPSRRNSYDDFDDPDLYSINISKAVVTSITRRTNLATGEPMPDTWNNGKGYIYITAKNSDDESLYDTSIEVTADSAIYQAGLAAAGGFDLTNLTFAPQTIDESTQTTHISFIESDNDNNTVFVVGKTVQGILKIEAANGQSITKNISMTAKGVYDKGWDESLINATVSSLGVVKKSGANPQYRSDTVGGVKHWLIPVTVFGSITGTKSDGTSYSKQYTGPDGTILDFTTIYNDIIENSGGSRTITQLDWTGSGYTNVNATFDKGDPQNNISLPLVEGKTLYTYAYGVGRNSVDALNTNSDGTKKISYESNGNATDYTKIWIELENSKKISNIELPKVEGKTLYSYAYDKGAAEAPKYTATVTWTDLNGNFLSPTNNSNSVNVITNSTYGYVQSRVYYTITYNDNTKITNNFLINTSLVYKNGLDYAKPISITRRTNLATGEPMPDTWNNGMGQIYVTAKNSDGEIYIDDQIEVTTDSAIYQAGFTAGSSSSSMRTATSLSYVTNDNNETDYSKVNVFYDKGESNTLSITNAFTIGRNSYTNTSKEFNSNDTYTPGTNERWSSVTVNVPVRTATIKWTDKDGNSLSYSNDNDSIRYDPNDHSSLVYYTLTYSDGSKRTASFWVNTYKAYEAGLNGTTSDIGIFTPNNPNNPNSSSDTSKYFTIKFNNDTSNYIRIYKESNEIKWQSTKGTSSGTLFTISNSSGGITINDISIKKAVGVAYLITPTATDEPVYISQEKISYENGKLTGGVTITLSDGTNTVNKNILVTMTAGSGVSSSSSWTENILQPDLEVIYEGDKYLEFSGQNTEYDSSNDSFVSRVRINHSNYSQTYDIRVDASKKAGGSSSSTTPTPTTGYTITSVEEMSYTTTPDYQFESSPTTRWGYNYLPIKINLSNNSYKTVQVYWEDSGSSGSGYTLDDINNARAQGQREMYRYYKMDLIWNYNGYVTQITAYDIDGNFIKSFNAREGDIFR